MARTLENANKALFVSDNYFDFPPCVPYTGHIDVNSLSCIDFNTARSKRDLSDYNCLHFYCDDYKFNCIWNNPNKYIDFLKKFDYVIMPDFSLYFDFPIALQIYNKYRNHWLASFFYLHNIHMIPNINLSTLECIPWSMLGYPQNSVVAVSDIGRIRDKSYREYRNDILSIIKNDLHPSQILYFTRSKEDLKDVFPIKLTYFK